MRHAALAPLDSVVLVVVSAIFAANAARFSGVRLQIRTSVAPVAATIPFTCIVAWKPAPITATGLPACAPARSFAA